MAGVFTVYRAFGAPGAQRQVVAAFIGIAPDLFAKAVQASGTELQQEMRSLLSRFFQTEAAPEGAASRSEKSVV